MQLSSWTRSDGQPHACYVQGPFDDTRYCLRDDGYVLRAGGLTRRVADLVIGMGANVSGEIIETTADANSLAFAIVAFIAMLHRVDTTLMRRARRNEDDLTKFWMKHALRMRAARVLDAAGLRSEEEVRQYGIERLLQEQHVGTKTAEELRRRFR